MLTFVTKGFSYSSSELRRTPLLSSLVTFTNPRGHLYSSACCLPKVLAYEQPLNAYLTGAIAQDGVERKLRKLCVLGVAPKGSTALMHHAAYLFAALQVGSGFQL